jgi:hypothetical protein
MIEVAERKSATAFSIDQEHEYLTEKIEPRFETPL